MSLTELFLIRQSTNTSIHLAAENGRLHVVEALVQEGADIEARNMVRMSLGKLSCVYVLGLFPVLPASFSGTSVRVLCFSIRLQTYKMHVVITFSPVNLQHLVWM